MSEDHPAVVKAALDDMCLHVLARIDQMEAALVEAAAREPKGL